MKVRIHRHKELFCDKCEKTKGGIALVAESEYETISIGLCDKHAQYYAEKILYLLKHRLPEMRDVKGANTSEQI